MTIGAECGKRGKIVVDLARAPAVPIAAKAGAEKQNVFHRIFRFWEKYHAGLVGAPFRVQHFGGWHDVDNSLAAGPQPRNRSFA